MLDLRYILIALKLEDLMNSFRLVLQRWSTVLIDPVSFFKNNTKNELLKIIPYIAWIVGISNSLNRIDSQINKGISLNSINSILIYAGNNWMGFWLVIFIAACIGGIFLWYFNGLIFRTLVILSKGDLLEKRDYREKAAILGLISSIPNILIIFIGTLTFKALPGLWWETSRNARLGA